MNYKLLFDTSGISVQDGLSKEEFAEIERVYKICFPDELRNAFSQCLPISKGFYNWRDFSEENIRHIERVMKEPFRNVVDYISDVEWNTEWGKEPILLSEKKDRIRELLLTVPKLIPIYSHRYIAVLNSGNSPIISISGIDMIYYGVSLEDYLMREFSGSKHELLSYDSVNKIPFWSYLVEEN